MPRKDLQPKFLRIAKAARANPSLSIDFLAERFCESRAVIRHVMERFGIRREKESEVPHG